MLLLDSDQTSNYNGLQITAASRPWHHVSFNSFYTLSKTMTSVQLQNNTTQGLAQNYSNLAEDYGRADTDQRHVFNLSVNWDIDYYRGGNAVVRHVVNGWSLSPIIKLRSGLPFTVTNNGVDANLDGVTDDRAQLIGDPTLSDPSARLWFNTAAFAQNKAVTGVATDGNSARNLLDGPCTTASIWRCRATSTCRIASGSPSAPKAPTSSTWSASASRAPRFPPRAPRRPPSA